MIIDIFKKNYITQALFVLISAITLWIGTFLSPDDVTVTEPYSLFYHSIASFALSYPLLSEVLAFLMILLEGAYFNYILSANNLTRKTSIFPMFMYIILMSMNPANQGFTPLIFSNAFLLVAIRNILNCYAHEQSYEKVFNASFCIALAFLFYFPSIYMLLFVFGAFAVYKLYYWREWFVLLLGFIAPFFALFAYYYIVDEFDTVVHRLSIEAIRASVVFDMSDTISIICSAFMVLFSVVSFFSMLSNMSSKVVIYRKKAMVMFILLQLGVVFSLYDMIFPVNQQNFVFPVAFMLTTFFISLKNSKKLCNVLFLMFLAVVYASVYLAN